MEIDAPSIWVRKENVCTMAMRKSVLPNNKRTKKPRRDIRRFLEEYRRLPPGYLLPVVGILGASFTVQPLIFSLISDFRSSCSAREGLQPIVPGAPWVIFGLQSYLLFVGSIFSYKFLTPAVTAV